MPKRVMFTQLQPGCLYKVDLSVTKPSIFVTLWVRQLDNDDVQHAFMWIIWMGNVIQIKQRVETVCFETAQQKYFVQLEVADAAKS